jgi:hypothetical protein
MAAGVAIEAGQVKKLDAENDRRVRVAAVGAEESNGFFLGGNRCR